jgi:hypothetical protein
MRQPLYTSWTITARTPETAHALERWLTDRIDPDRVITSTTKTWPGGGEQVQTVPHRLGDYFAAIRLLPASDPTSFRLVFQRLPEAGRYWKDLMVHILQEIEAAPEQASITLDYKGDEEPATSVVRG